MFGIWYDIDVKPVKKVAQKYTMKLVRIHLIFKNKIAITANFLAFFFFLKFSLPGSGSSRENEWIHADQDPQPCFCTEA